MRPLQEKQRIKPQKCRTSSPLKKLVYFLYIFYVKLLTKVVKYEATIGKLKQRIKPQKCRTGSPIKLVRFFLGGGDKFNFIFVTNALHLPRLEATLFQIISPISEILQNHIPIYFIGSPHKKKQPVSDRILPRLNNKIIFSALYIQNHTKRRWKNKQISEDN